MDKNTCQGLQKHLTLGGLKLSGSQLYLSCWRIKFFQADLKKKGIKKNSANPTSSWQSSLFVNPSVWMKKMDVCPPFCTVTHGVRVVGPDVGEAVLAHSPALLNAWSTAWPNCFMSLFPCLASWSRFALSVPEALPCLEIKFDHPMSCFLTLPSILLTSTWLEEHTGKQNRSAEVQSVPCLWFVLVCFGCQTLQSTFLGKSVMQSFKTDRPMLQSWAVFWEALLVTFIPTHDWSSEGIYLWYNRTWRSLGYLFVWLTSANTLLKMLALVLG